MTLTGSIVTLEPLSQQHHDALVEATSDGEMWKLWYTSIPSPEGMRAEIDRRLALLAKGDMVPLVTRRNDTGQVVGMTTYMNIDAKNRRVEIGSTWNRASAQRSGTNTESKLLMLTQAFEVWNCIAVEFRTHFFNQQSRTAMPASAPNRTASCAITSSSPTAASATPWSSRSFRPSGPRRETTCCTGSLVVDSAGPARPRPAPRLSGPPRRPSATFEVDHAVPTGVSLILSACHGRSCMINFNVEWVSSSALFRS